MKTVERWIKNKKCQNKLWKMENVEKKCEFGQKFSKKEELGNIFSAKAYKTKMK